ncbi:hypothetical protein H2200_001319 [Cladophialophora chaetospira]|uniref:Uncharacterized protein n=1 Tax=Cladophialophora chaetospira TaxID=386627 RepID=A0AA38XLF5_9EURO|nr:hypothetical protein H2200_001319 [Cladophialophora chaetospira]
MCFGSTTDDDPTQPIRTTTAWGLRGQKEMDPTKQPIHISESNEAHMSESQGEPDRRRKSSYRNKAAFVDFTDGEHKVVRKQSNPEPPATQPDPRKNAQKQWRGRSTNPATFGLGFGSDFAATPA